MNVYDHHSFSMLLKQQQERPEWVEHCNGITEVRVRIPIQAFLAAA